jgi:phosphoribosyl 1,2-cyclic phosphate phosphodiesterase
VEDEDKVIVVDTGPDFRQQMLQASVEHLDAVLYTHEHRDHIAGLDDIRAFNFIQKSSMDIYAEERVERALMSMFPYVFAEKKYPGVPQVAMQTIDTGPFQIGAVRVIPIRMMHYRLPVLGFRFGSFAYLTDANFISEHEKEKLIGVKYLVVNALRKEAHISHFTLQQAVDLILELSPRKAFLTHISHQMGPSSEFSKDLPSHIVPAYDGLVLEV